MKKIYLLFVFCLGILFVRGEGIEFFKGTFNAALEKAKTEKKMIFVDFMATWCGPCKKLSTEVFTDKEVGNYFNKHFVCIKVDVDKEKQLALRYQVDAMPTLVFFDPEGKEIKRLMGFMPVELLLKRAKEVKGELPSFDVLWGNYEKNGTDLKLMQNLLVEFPYVIQEKEEQIWMDRVTELFGKYIELKPRKEMINKVDFDIFVTYARVEKGDDMMQFVCSHLADYLKVVPFGEVYNAIIPYTGGKIDALAKVGNLEYKQLIEQAVTQQKMVFDSLEYGKWTLKEFLTNRADAYYMLYAKKDQNAFVKLKREYLEKMGDKVSPDTFHAIIDDLFTATNGNLTDESCQQCIQWLNDLLKREGKPELSVEDLSRIYLSMGECYAILKDVPLAEKNYKQAYDMASQLNAQEYMEYIQQRMNLLK